MLAISDILKYTPSVFASHVETCESKDGQVDILAETQAELGFVVGEISPPNRSARSFAANKLLRTCASD
jgi:hypothetical protein